MSNSSSSVCEINKFAFEGNLDDLKAALTNCSSFDKLVDPQDSNRGPLHFAVLGGQVEVVRVLLEDYNFSPFQLDEDGWNPLHIAASVGKPEIIELLIEAVANWPMTSPTHTDDAVALYCNRTTADRSKQSPLHFAAAKGHEEAVLRLICHGAKASLRNSFGQTPLHRAACAGKPLVLAALIESDPSIVNWKDFSEDSNTALHLAAEDGHLEVVRFLVEVGQADKNIQNAQNKTAAQVAQNREIRDYLDS